MGVSRSRACPGAGARRRCCLPRRRSFGRTAWRADRRQRHLRYRRHADRKRLAHLQRAPPGSRRDVRCRPAQRRRRHHRQDGNDRAGVAHPGEDAQSAQSRAHPGRLLGRLGRRRRRPHGAGGARQPDGRLDHPPGVVLRRLRLQADARPRAAFRRSDAVPHARYRRRLRPLGGGSGARHRLHGGIRGRRHSELPAQPAGPAQHGAL